MKVSNASSSAAALSDATLLERIGSGDQAAFEGVMRKYNGKLFRVARAILKDDTDAEDVLQDAYLDAYRHLGEFRGDSELSTWLTRIVVNQALMRLRREKRAIVNCSVSKQVGARWGDSGDASARSTRSESPSTGAIRAETTAHPRAPNRRASQFVSHGLRHARSRRHEHGRDCRMPVDFTGYRPNASLQSPRAAS